MYKIETCFKMSFLLLHQAVHQLCVCVCVCLNPWMTGASREEPQLFRSRRQSDVPPLHHPERGTQLTLSLLHTLSHTHTHTHTPEIRVCD